MSNHSPHSCCSACDREDVEKLPLTDLSEALERMANLVQPVTQTEKLSLGKALGRILAEDVKSAIPLPVSNNSAVDGYAVRLSAMQGEPPYSLPITGRVAAGDNPEKITPDSVCVRILTGASLPDWADAVIMQEDTTLSEDESQASFPFIPEQNANIRFSGEDVPKGSVIIEKGAKIDTRHIAIAAASGLAELTVTRPIRVALLATGSELNQPGAPLPPGGIYDSNTPMLVALLSQPHIDLTLHRPVKDDFETIQSSIASLAEDHDLLLTSGGMSVSDEDYIRRAVAAEAGQASWFWPDQGLYFRWPAWQPLCCTCGMFAFRTSSSGSHWWNGQSPATTERASRLFYSKRRQAAGIRSCSDRRRKRRRLAKAGKNRPRRLGPPTSIDQCRWPCGTAHCR